MISYKSVTGAVLDVDDASRRVKVVISEMGSKDFDDDIIDPKAYDKTLKERGPLGKNKIYHLTDHRPDLKNTLGKFKELYTQGNQLIGVTDINKTGWGNDVLEMYKAGTITEHSVGFQATRMEPPKGDTPRIITEIKLYEGSAVLLGANENTPTLSVGKSGLFKIEDWNSGLDEFFNMIKAAESLEDLQNLAELHILRLKEFNVQPPSTTHAADKAPAPEKDNKNEELIKQLRLLTFKII